jgi:ketosteroid isomerase-like protein
MESDLEARVRKLEAKVQELSDLEAIRDLRYRYHELINEGNYTEILDLFTDDAEIDFAHLGRGKGRAALAKFFGSVNISPASSGKGLYSFVKQFIHNMAVHVHGDTADGFSYLEAKPIHKGESYLVAARYDDEYVRQNGTWKFKKMALTPYFMVPLREGWAQENRIKMTM